MALLVVARRGSNRAADSLIYADFQSLAGALGPSAREPIFQWLSPIFDRRVQRVSNKHKWTPVDGGRLFDITCSAATMAALLVLTLFLPDLDDIDE
jgi:hypothetical protein